jgi:hypothetical protein
MVAREEQYQVINLLSGNTIAVLGYGSLLSEASARETIPSLSKFELVQIPGYKRIFNKVGIVFFERYGASETDIRISSCATRKDPQCCITASLFECSEADFLLMYEREHRFQWVNAQYQATDGSTGYARMCTENSDENYLLNKCITESEYWRRVGRFYVGKIWREDILPFPTYLKHCLDAADSHGTNVLDNFLDFSFLADGKTSIRTYMRATPDWDAGARDRYTHGD